ncbi:DNA-binding response regulator [Brumimicrobium salinarum]|uniref:DNA-binding response regulator n=1 Tax=Brumimicrobium salinarum TaxID=2058658 RepID=A0A2I0QZX3_9FLAO|nr:LytTR family DNA-binding domain-containing protein [Brumimicrobium salinarum]PKR79859.1 DNA-binding response regulator [Brumimicrobium salinarum]
MELRAIIVDDEELARKNLALMLERNCPEIDLIGEASDIDEAESIIKSAQPDVVFLDIRMPSGSEGFDLLERLENRNFLVVFVTAFKDYAIRAFQSNAVHYVLKPIDEDDLKIAVDKLIATKETFTQHPENYDNYFEALQNLADRLIHNKTNSKIAISHTKGVKIIEDDDLAYLEASGNCSMLYFKDGTRYLDTRTLKVYESILNTDKFYRIHKSYIINMDMIKEYVSEDGYTVILKNKIELPVARNRVSAFLKTIKEM